MPRDEFHHIRISFPKSRNNSDALRCLTVRADTRVFFSGLQFATRYINPILRRFEHCGSLTINGRNDAESPGHWGKLKYNLK